MRGETFKGEGKGDWVFRKRCDGTAEARIGGCEKV